jgi:hypothetical protein
MRAEGKREMGIMSEDVFNQSLELLKYTVSRGTQMEVNLNGIGEPLLDPDIVTRVRRVKEILGYEVNEDGTPKRAARFCTNGILLTYELCKQIKHAGIDFLDVSVHSAKHARKAASILMSLKMQGVLAAGAIIYPHNWAGQLEPENTVPNVLHNVTCDPLKHGYGYIQREGLITACCFDYQNLGVFGKVWDDDIFDKPIRPYALCDECHQIIPEEELQENAA